MAEPPRDFSGLRATFLNCTLKRSPEVGNTQGSVDASADPSRAEWPDLCPGSLASGVPGYGHQRSEWNAGARFDYENPEYRS